MNPRIQLLYLLLCLATAAPPCPAGATSPEVTFESLLREMVNRDRLARLPDPPYTAHEASSTERRSVAPGQPGWFANNDWSHYIREEVNEGRKEWVMMDAAGPGALVRFWMGAPMPERGPVGTLRFYLDGSPHPAIEQGADALLSGRGLVAPPLSAVRSIGRNLYLPIPYGSRCKVTYDRPPFWETKKPEDRNWYVIEYRTYCPGTRVRSFELADLERSAQTLRRVQQTLLLPRETLDRVTRMVPGKAARLAPGGAIKTAIEGPAALQRLAVHIQAADVTQALRSTVIRVRCDGEETIWCPVGDFFGSGIGLNPYRSWNRDVDRNGLMTCYWVMPFETSCEIRLENLGKQHVDARLGWLGLGPWRWDERSLHFHGTWRQECSMQTKKADGFDWNYVEIQGRGVYVGDTLALRNGAGPWWGEGDEKIFVDGESFPSLFGTGTEDYYGYSFGDRGVFFEAPFHAEPRWDGNNKAGYVTVTRSRSLDAIPFSKSLKFDMEIWHWSQTTVSYAATTYWYARPGAASNRPPLPREASRPVPGSPLRLPGAIEGETIRIHKKTGGVTELQENDSWSGGKHLWWRDGKPGDVLEVVLPVRKAGRYKIVLRGTWAFDYGIFQVHIDGKKLGDSIDLYSKEGATRSAVLGERSLSAGDHVLVFEIVGTNPAAKTRYMLGLDALLLDPVSR